MNILSALILTAALSGCYTQVWMPNENIQSTDNQNYQEDSYYPVNYYGEDYNYYYDYPWWYALSPSIYSSTSPSNRDTSQSQLVRQRDSGRGGVDTRGIIFTTPARTEPAATTSTSTTTTSSNSSTGSNQNRVENNNSNSSSSGNRSSSNNNTVRNNDGGRSNNNGRK